MNQTLNLVASTSASAIRRKPRIMVAGEFSAGKSFLINALLEKEVLPSNVTSTAMPPIWLVGGAGGSFSVRRDGEIVDFDITKTDINETAFCVVSADSEILRYIDIIDTPGNSDPNIPSEHWERMVQYADGLVWCTSAMQAWKQSEKATVADLPEDLRAQALLMITQADRMPDERAAAKVQRRVERDAGKYFADVAMGSMVRDSDVRSTTSRLIELAAGMALRGSEEPAVERLRPMQPKAKSATTLASHPAVEPCGVAKADATETTQGRETDASPEISLGLPNGTLAAVWRNLENNADLSDNQAFLEQVAALLESTKDILSKQSDSNAAAEAKAD